MKIIVTGKTGVGKTTILKDLKFENTLFMDDFVKENFYVSGHPVFDEVVNLFGTEIISFDKIDTRKLWGIVLSDRSKLQKLSYIVIPFVKRYIQSLEGNWLIEMAGYINYQKEFENVFDKVILVTRDEESITKKLLDKEGNTVITIKDVEVKNDFKLVNNGVIEESVKKLHKILWELNFKNI